MGTTMLVQPTGYAGNNGGGFGGFGGDGWWILLLFILLGGWNNGFGGNMGGGMGGMYPWMNQSNQISDGFQTQMLNDNLNGICGTRIMVEKGQTLTTEIPSDAKYLVVAHSRDNLSASVSTTGYGLYFPADLRISTSQLR